MKALLWKDYRLNRMILILGAAFIVGPYLIVILQQWLRPQRTWSPMVGADLLGAAIGFISKENKGSTFWFTIPLTGNSKSKKKNTDEVGL